MRPVTGVLWLAGQRWEVENHRQTENVVAAVRLSGLNRQIPQDQSIQIFHLSEDSDPETEAARAQGG